MRWIYRLQQRLAITQAECNTLTTLAVLIALGLSVQYVQSQPRPLPPDVYAERDRLFWEAVAASEQAAISEQTAAAVLIEEPTAQAVPASTPRMLPPVRPVAVADTVPPPAADAAAPETQPSEPLAVLQPARMNLNTATSRQLQRLPRIGPKMAERILAYRAEHGPFRRVDDLVEVRGIGEKTLEKLRPLLFVEER